MSEGNEAPIMGSAGSSSELDLALILRCAALLLTPPSTGRRWPIDRLIVSALLDKYIRGYIQRS